MEGFERVTGREVWKVDSLCIWCKAPVFPEQEYLKVGAHLFHPRCLQQLLSLPPDRFEEALKSLPLDVVEALTSRRRGDPPRRAAQREGVAQREVRLSELARRAVDAALRRAGVERVYHMRADGMFMEPYGEFLSALREEVLKLAKPGVQLRFEPSLYGRGYGDTNVYLQGELWGVWRPQHTTTIVSSFWSWVDRVVNLLREMDRRGLLREEVL